MLKKLITKNQNSRRIIFFNKNKRLNTQDEYIQNKPTPQPEKESNNILKSVPKDL